MEILQIFLPPILFAYLIGSIPFGLILGKLAGVGDIRKIGSGNIGATNMLRTGRKDIAIATLLLDGLKGWVAVAFFTYCYDIIFTGVDPYISLRYIQGQQPLGVCGMISELHEQYSDGGYFSCKVNIITSLFVVLGHIFPIWLKFKGGKGVATAIGAAAALSPFLALTIIAIWLLVFLITRISSLSALLAFFLTYVIIHILNAFFPMPRYESSDPYIAYTYVFHSLVVSSYMFCVTIIIFFTHRQNIVRIFKGTEHKWSSKK